MRGKMRAYAKVIRVTERYTTLKSIKKLLYWDERVMMNPGLQKIRAKENNAIATTIHRHLISSVLHKNIVAAKKEQLTNEEQLTLKEIESDHNRLKNVKQSLITSREKAHSKSLNSWKLAYNNNDFSLFEKDFETTIRYAKRYGKSINKNNPYEALLQDFEKDLSLSEIESLLLEVKEKALSLLKNKEETNKINIEKIDVPEHMRKQFGFFLAEKVGVDFSRARFDWSNRSFSTYFGRLAIRPTNWIDEIQTIMHESGHSMYELGLPLENYGSPLYEVRSFAMDEAMAMIWEKHVCQSDGFWTYFLPIIKESFRNIPYDKATILNELHRVNKSIIRLNSDELSYILHIYLRFELEKDLINGTLKVKKLPSAWNKKIKKYFNNLPKNHKEGVLQDIHWSKGSIGYFPSYIIGLIIAAQIMNTVKKEIPNLEEHFTKGDFSFLKNWLDEKVHKQGKRYSTKELIKKITGENITAKHYLKYLDKKYSN